MLDFLRNQLMHGPLGFTLPLLGAALTSFVSLAFPRIFCYIPKVKRALDKADRTRVSSWSWSRDLGQYSSTNRGRTVSMKLDALCSGIKDDEPGGINSGTAVLLCKGFSEQVSRASAFAEDICARTLAAIAVIAAVLLVYTVAKMTVPGGGGWQEVKDAASVFGLFVSGPNLFAILLVGVVHYWLYRESSSFK